MWHRTDAGRVCRGQNEHYKKLMRVKFDAIQKLPSQSPTVCPRSHPQAPETHHVGGSMGRLWIVSFHGFGLYASLSAGHTLDKPLQSCEYRLTTESHSNDLQSLQNNPELKWPQPLLNAFCGRLSKVKQQKWPKSQCRINQFVIRHLPPSIDSFSDILK